MTTFNGGPGDDHFNGGAGADSANGGGGDDVLKGGGGGDDLVGGFGDDLLKGGAGDDYLYDFSGQDSLFGGSGDDYMTEIGGDGPVLLDGGSGDDTISSQCRNATLLGGGGDDLLAIDLRHVTHVVADGGSGADIGVVTYLGLDRALNVRFASTTDGVITAKHGAVEITNVERTIVFLSAHDDVAHVEDGRFDLVGGDGDDSLFGGAGPVFLQGDGGNDLLKGEGGDDSLDGGAGDDRLAGGAGFDQAYFSTAQNAITVDLRIRGPQDTGAGIDTLSSIEGARGSRYSDLIIGDKGDNYLRPGDVDTTAPASDTLIGGGGDDRLGTWAGVQSDVLTGGSGADSFIFFSVGVTVAGAVTRITDLTHKDTIDLSQIDADTTTAGDQAFHLVDKLDGHAGEAALEYDRANNRTVLSLDVDGDGAADVTAWLEGLHTTFDNFVL